MMTESLDEIEAYYRNEKAFVDFNQGQQSLKNPNHQISGFLQHPLIFCTWARRAYHLFLSLINRCQRKHKVSIYSPPVGNPRWLAACVFLYTTTPQKHSTTASECQELISCVLTIKSCPCQFALFHLVLQHLHYKKNPMMPLNKLNKCVWFYWVCGRERERESVCYGEYEVSSNVIAVASVTSTSCLMCVSCHNFITVIYDQRQSKIHNLKNKHFFF